MHIIRLRGPWELEPLHRYVLHEDGTYRPEKQDLPAPARMKMPANWSAAFGTDFLGRVIYRRVFHRPTGLEGSTRVFLVVDPATSVACVTLKKKLVGFVYPGEGTGRFDITNQLDADITLEIIVDHPGVELVHEHADRHALQSTVGDPRTLPPGGLVGEVRLEIEDVSS